MTNSQATISSRGKVPMRLIRKLAEDIAREFRPSRIILFGSHATGKATADSDVDMLVLFKTRQRPEKSLTIRRRVEYSFALDLIVMDEARLQRRLKWHDFFLMDITETGKVLYESSTA